jgi:preprotein translocase subunit SecE
MRGARLEERDSRRDCELERREGCPGMSVGEIVLLCFLVLAAVLVAVFRTQIGAAWQATKKFVREVRIEMRKVSWPTRNDIIANTIVVLVAVVILSVIITIWDQILSFVIRWILPGGGV